MPGELSVLSRLLSNEVIQAMGLPAESVLGVPLRLLLERAARRLCGLFVECDRLLGISGLLPAARWLLANLADDLRIRGAEHIPAAGPLILASNHPGTVDAPAPVVAAQRPDMKIVASAIPFLQHFPHVARHLIFVAHRDIHARMIAVCEAIRHLQRGGALLLFAHGRIDPDPAFMPDVEQDLPHWSHSLAVFLQRVPHVQIITGVVSHVLDPRYMHHPLTWLRRTRIDRQRLAMMMQVIHQMLGKKPNLTPHLSFSEPLHGREMGDSEHAMQTILQVERDLLRFHRTWAYEA